MPAARSRILILGGTSEARALAERLTAAERYDVVTSLAGVTRTPPKPAGELRIGRFGGVESLQAFLQAEGIALVVDATHPFAAQISAHAAQACAAAGVPCLRLERPAWTPQPGDDWRQVGSVTEAASAIPAGATALVTIGRQEIGEFTARGDIRVVARMIEPPEGDVGPQAEILLARPPFAFAEEKALMESRHIDVLVTKNSGGEATATKLTAARDLRLPVIMIARPAKPAVPSASSVEAMIELIAAPLA